MSESRAAHNLRIQPIGNLGNQLLQYVGALSLAKRIGNCEITGYDIPILRQDPARAAVGGRGFFILRSYLIDFDQIASLARQYRIRRIAYRTLVQRCENFPDRSELNNLLLLPEVDRSMLGDDKIVINIRGAEILGDRHTAYGPIPISFYEELIARTGKSPVFMGQIGNDWYSEHLRSRFRKAVFLQSQGPIGDFAMMASARHLVISVSAFSWMAGWLSHAKTIHLPMLGLFNPEQWPNINLLPLRDHRYHFYRFPARHWHAAPEDVEWVTSAHVPFKPASTSELKSVLEECDQKVAAERAKVRTATQKMAKLEALAERLGAESIRRILFR